MAFQYPFKSESRRRLAGLRENLDYYTWHTKAFDLRAAVGKIDRPVIEIGGPTEYGFFFADGIDFNSKPVITNFSSNPLPFASNAKKMASLVEQIVDGRDMPYSDGSVGVFLMSAMSRSNDWWVELSDKEKEKVSTRFNEEGDIAALEMGQFALGSLPLNKVRFAQRVQIYAEMYRTLDKDGLLFCDGDLEDLLALQRLGFRLVAYYQEHIQVANWDGISYEFVVQK